MLLIKVSKFISAHETDAHVYIRNVDRIVDWCPAVAGIQQTDEYFVRYSTYPHSSVM